MTLDDFRRLNIRDVGNWPLAPKIGILLLLLIVVVGLGALLDWKEQYDALDAAQVQETRLREQYTAKKVKAINYDL